MVNYMYRCYPMPIIKYYTMLQNVYGRSALLKLCKWKLKDNYTFTYPEQD